MHREADHRGTGHPVAVAGSVVLRDLAGEIRDIPFQAMLPTVKALKKMAADEGTTMSLNGRRPAKLRAVDRQLPGRAADVVVWRIQGVPVGPWVWQTSGTKAHDTRRRKRGKKSKMLVHHPGSSGSGRWTRVDARAQQIVTTVFTDYTEKVLRGR